MVQSGPQRPMEAPQLPQLTKGRRAKEKKLLETKIKKNNLLIILTHIAEHIIINNQ